MAFPRSPLEGGTEVGNACDCIDQQWCSTQRGPPQELKEPCPPLCRCEDQPSTRSVCQQERLWMAHCACLGTAVHAAPAVTAVCVASSYIPALPALLCNGAVHSLRTMIEFLSIPSSTPVTEPKMKERSFVLCPSTPHVSLEHANIGADCGSSPLPTVKMQ